MAILRAIIPSSAAPAADIRVLSVGTVGPALREIFPKYQQEFGDRVQVIYGNPVAILNRLRQGELADLAIVATALWDDVSSTGRIVPDTRVLLGTTPYAVAVKTGGDHPNVTDLQGFKRVLENARSVALVDRSPSTGPMMKGLEQLGMAAQVASKVKTFATGEVVAEALAHDEADVGITTMSELLSNANVRVLGPVPSEILSFKAGSLAALISDATQPQAARRLLQFLVSPTTKLVFKAKGIDPN